MCLGCLNCQPLRQEGGSTGARPADAVHIVALHSGVIRFVSADERVLAKSAPAGRGAPAQLDVGDDIGLLL